MKRLALPLLLLLGCANGAPATAADCDALFDRMVALELKELGFRDPALLNKRTRALKARMSAELALCERRKLPAGALSCAAQAQSVEELSHRCLH